MLLLTLALLTATPDDLDTLIRRLGHDDFPAREQTAQKILALLRMKPGLRERISRAAEGASDPEVVRRLRTILVAVNWNRTPPIPVPPRRYWMKTSDGERFAFWGGRDEEGRRTDGAVFDGERWRALSAAPLAGRVGVTVHLAGRNLLVWGGGTLRREDDEGRATPHYYTDGALYDLETGAVRVVPPAPIAGRVYARCFESDGKVVVWGGAQDFDKLQSSEGYRGHVSSTNDWLPDGTLLDLKTLQWTKIPPPPIAIQDDQRYWDADVAWHDGKLLALFGTRHDAQMNLLYIKGAAAYDPATNRWTKMPECPLPLSGTFTSTSSGALLWSGYDTRHPESGRLAIYDGAWKEHPRPAIAGDWFGVKAGRLLVWDDFRDQKGSVFDLATSRWIPVPKVPHGSRQWTEQLWNGKELVIWGGGEYKKGYKEFSDGARWNVGEESWTPIARFPGRTPGRRWADSTARANNLIIWGGDTHERRRGWTDKESGEYLDDAFIYDTALDTWSRAPTGGPLSDWIRGPEFAWLRGRLLILAPDASRAVAYSPDQGSNR